MSDEARAWAKKVTGLRIAEKSVLNALAGYADADGKAWPKVATLATVTCMSARHVARVLNRLEEQSLIKRENRWRAAGGNTSNYYWLAIPDGELIGARSDTSVSDKHVRPLSDRNGHSCQTQITSVDLALSEESLARAHSSDRPGRRANAGANSATVLEDRAVAIGSANDWVGVPTEIIDQAAAIPQLGEAWARSWLVPCSWDADKREIIPRTLFARGRITRELGPYFGELDVSVGEPRGLRE